jgi:hypothetical protein
MRDRRGACRKVGGARKVSAIQNEPWNVLTFLQMIRNAPEMGVFIT